MCSCRKFIHCRRAEIHRPEYVLPTTTIRVLHSLSQVTARYIRTQDYHTTATSDGHTIYGSRRSLLHATCAPVYVCTCSETPNKMSAEAFHTYFQTGRQPASTIYSAKLPVAYIHTSAPPAACAVSCWPWPHCGLSVVFDRSAMNFWISSSCA